jgi:hypothetical protein
MWLSRLTEWELGGRDWKCASKLGLLCAYNPSFPFLRNDTCFPLEYPALATPLIYHVPGNVDDDAVVILEP